MPSIPPEGCNKNQYLIFSIQIGDSAYVLEGNHGPECHLIEV